MIELKIVEGKSDLKKFIHFPFDLFKGNAYWVPPLNSAEMETLDAEKNPAFEHCSARYWLAYKDGKLVGRIAGIINHLANEKWGKKVRFGWIDFVEDVEVARALLTAVEEWGRGQGMEAITGPLGFNDMDNEGMLVEGFDKLPTIANIYNYPYYPQFMEQLGYQRQEDWLQFIFDASQPVPEKMERVNQLLLEKLEREGHKVRVLTFKKAKDILPYGHSFFHTLNAAFAGLYGFSELTEKEIDKLVKDYFSFINPKFVCMVVDEHDEVIAFGVSMSTLSTAFQKAKGNLFPFGFIHLLRALHRTDQVDLYLNGVHPDWQKRGVHALYYTQLNKAYIENHVKLAISNQQLESNIEAVGVWNHYEKKPYIRRRCYNKAL